MEEGEWVRTRVRELKIGDAIRYHEFEGHLQSIVPTTDESRVLLKVNTPAGAGDELQLDLDWQVLRYVPPRSSSSSSA